MKKLIEGLHKFKTEVFPIQKDFFQDLMHGQSPETLFITCSDSRINPHMVTSAEPGDLFIVRNAGNIVPVYGSGGGEAATIEFAIDLLKVKHVVICGHSHCGAITAGLKIETLADTPTLCQWIGAHITPTIELVQKNYQDLDAAALVNIVTQEHVLRQIENLKTHPSIARAIARNELTLYAWVYKFEAGDIFAFNQKEGQFQLIKHVILEEAL